MRFLLLLMILAMPGLASAQPQLPMSVKERLRLLLWTEGLTEPKSEKNEDTTPRGHLPEEIAKPLRNL